MDKQKRRALSLIYAVAVLQFKVRFRLRLCGAFGSPRFDARSPICIVAADDRFPECLPTEVPEDWEVPFK